MSDSSFLTLRLNIRCHECFFACFFVAEDEDVEVLEGARPGHILEDLGIKSSLRNLSLKRQVV